jgi:hypothetical protein
MTEEEHSTRKFRPLRVLAAVLVGLAVWLILSSVYYRWRLARDGICVDIAPDGRVVGGKFGECE